MASSLEKETKRLSMVKEDDGFVFNGGEAHNQILNLGLCLIGRF